MSDTVIRVENLGKKYIIGRQKQDRYLTLRDAIAQTARSVGQHFLPSKHKEKLRLDQEEFWALKDVSFEIKQGDRVGIIGRNGAGKSTLLKILSRITEPTTGRISIKGRVASLLEVGTGFHPELTGRENIYLNGAILGMGKTEINRKFDEIIAFAEVEKFLDTPVKRYSSGMYVRLAFAVAAHLEPEVLLIDEVLAVGDVQFQRKCLGKMEEVAEEGRTVIFVSHNMATVKQLCSKAFLVSEGTLIGQGSSLSIISQYTQMLITPKNSHSSYKHIKGDGRGEIRKIFVSSEEQGAISIFENIKILIEYFINELISELEFFVIIHSVDGEAQISLFQRDSNIFIKPELKNGKVVLRLKNYLMPGKYFVSAGIFDKSRQFIDWVEYAETFYVEDSFNDGRKYDNRIGKVSILGTWESS
ncbi:ABC transporter ATP-binding protein [Trichocoleus desertorum AS-A10]|uniref:ABC transporter ATP-binding protein n=1 Tax=Trichocoleus desertorum TaxID=1481672 RepID=UPI0032976CC1